MASISQPGKLVSGLRLGTFVVVSIVVHSLLLAGWFQNTPSFPATSSLSVVLVNPPQDKTADTEKKAKPDKVRAKETIEQVNDKAQSKPKPVAKSKTSVDETPVAEVAPLAPPTPQTTMVVKTESTPVENSAATPTLLEPKQTPTFSLGQVRNKIRDQLTQDLARHFQYPGVARRRGWEGTVLLDLLIETDGRISRISVAQSSGYSLFDKSAIKAMTKVGNVGDAARWLQGRSLEMQLPVIYRLTDS